MEFHYLVVKILFVSKRARPDTCTSISFLTTRVRKPENDDWAKFILSSNGSSIIKWWIGASFAVYPNIRVNTGGGTLTGRGFTIVISTEQNMNTRSSTETEIVTVDD